MGMGVIQAASQGAFNASPYVSPGLTNSFTQPPSNPYAPSGTGYSTGNLMPGYNSAAPNPQDVMQSRPSLYGAAASGSSNSLNTAPQGGMGGGGGPFPLEGKYGIVKMANGGIAEAAQNMASKGRGGDSMLVHMTPNEVGGLQALAMAHGGSLSINPHTGLPEASFLKNLLPTIAGIGLSMIPGVGPLMAAGIVGGGTALATGDINKGLMAGLGAYGGAGLGAGLSSLGGSQAGLAAGAEALGTTPEVLGTTEGMTKALEMGTETGDIIGLDPNKVERFAGAYEKAAQPSLTNMGSGIKQAFQPDGLSQLYNALPTGTVPSLGMTAAGAVQDAFTPKAPGVPEEDPRYKGSPYRYNLASNFGGYTPARPNPYYTPTGLGYAAGGDIMMAAGGSYDDEPRGDDQGFGFAAGGDLKLGEGIARDTDEDTASLNAFDAAKKRVAKINKAANMPKKYAAQMPQVRGLGELAIAQGGSIGGYSDGGRMLKGPGDGMSDSIPAVIGKKQPARLADGEFVVPADVVSHLGNGSTDAGAKRLYGMMDKVRKARTGKKKQAPAVKAEKYMPA